MTDRKLVEVELAKIRTNPYQPRKYFDEEALVSLAESISEVGLIQPVTVRKSGEFYELVAGERRLKACNLAGLESIPAIVVDVDRSEQHVMALVENIQRKDLSSVEEALSLKKILDQTGWAQSELARRLGRSQASVANKLRLLKLEDQVQQKVIEGIMGERTARALVGLAPALQISASKKIIDQGLSAHDAEKLVKRLKEGEPLDSKPSNDEEKAKSSSPEEKLTLSFRGPEGPTGELLHKLAELIDRERKKGVPVIWKVRELAQSELIVEIVVDLKEQFRMKESRDE